MKMAHTKNVKVSCASLCIQKIHFNNILPITPTSQMVSFPCASPNKSPYNFLFTYWHWTSETGTSQFCD